MPNSKPKDGVPSGQEFTALKTYLLKNKPDDWERDDWVDKIVEICGDDVNERTREEIMDDLIEWMKTYPKAEG